MSWSLQGPSPDHKAKYASILDLPQVKTHTYSKFIFTIFCVTSCVTVCHQLAGLCSDSSLSMFCWVALAALAGCQKHSKNWRVKMVAFQYGGTCRLQAQSTGNVASPVTHPAPFPFLIRHVRLPEKMEYAGIRAQACQLEVSVVSEVPLCPLLYFHMFLILDQQTQPGKIFNSTRS